MRDRKDWLLEMLSLLDRMVVRFDQCSLPTVQLHKLGQDLIRRKYDLGLSECDDRRDLGVEACRDRVCRGYYIGAVAGAIAKLMMSVSSNSES